MSCVCPPVHVCMCRLLSHTLISNDVSLTEETGAPRASVPGRMGALLGRCWPLLRTSWGHPCWSPPAASRQQCSKDLKVTTAEGHRNLLYVSFVRAQS